MAYASSDTSGLTGSGSGAIGAYGPRVLARVSATAGQYVNFVVQVPGQRPAFAIKAMPPPPAPPKPPGPVECLDGLGRIAAKLDLEIDTEPAQPSAR